MVQEVYREEIHHQQVQPAPFANYNNIYGTARVTDKSQRNRIWCHFLPLFLASLALTIATGIYLFNIEENNMCWGPRRGYNLQDERHWVDVGRRFFLILCLFFAYYVVQMIRSIFVLLSTIARLHVISSVHSFLFLNEFLGLGTLALAHIYRF